MTITKKENVFLPIETTLANEIRTFGPISFAHFMELALYHFQYGFYTAQNYWEHFETAPCISTLFAKCIANELKSFASDFSILEIGAGNGKLACDLIHQLQSYNALPKHYQILEKSLHLRNVQQQRVAKELPLHGKLFQWLEDFPPTGNYIVLMNEVLDALPTHRFHMTNNGLFELVVDYQGGRFVAKDILPDGRLKKAVHQLQEICHIPNAYQSEINLNIQPFMEKVHKTINNGVCFIFDYGYGVQEFYHPERRQGTLTSFYKHQRVDPFRYPGQADLTSHVNFTQVMEIASVLDFECLGFTTQAGFLLANDLMKMAEEIQHEMPLQEEIHFNNQIKKLTFPSEMGEVVKVLAIGKNFITPLKGFSMHDRRRDL